MVHIDLAPSQKVPDQVLQETIIEIITDDESSPPTQWKLESIYPLKLHQLTSVSTLPSHGLESFEFAKWFIYNNAGSNTNTEVAVYYYRKLES